jgi:hypothetical protein
MYQEEKVNGKYLAAACHLRQSWSFLAVMTMGRMTDASACSSCLRHDEGFLTPCQTRHLLIVANKCTEGILDIVSAEALPSRGKGNQRTVGYKLS